MTLASLIRFLPGLIGALSAFVLVKLVAWVTSFSLELLLFTGTYVGVTIALDVGLRRYGRED